MFPHPLQCRCLTVVAVVISCFLHQSLVAAPPEEFRYIDTHVHFHDRKDGDLDKVIEWMDQMKIDRVINHPLAQSRVKTDDERSAMLRNYAKAKGRIDRFCIIFPEEVQTVDEAVAILRKEKESGAIGFGEHYGVNLNFDDPSCMRLFEACEKVGMPVMFHMDRNKNLDEPGFPRLKRVLEAYPKLILIAHSDWWRQSQQGACGELLAKYPNLYADISCTVKRSAIGKDKEFARKFFTTHADKLLFGSDSGWWSFGKEPMPEFQFILDLDLPAEVLQKICGGNARKLFWEAQAPANETNNR